MIELAQLALGRLYYEREQPSKSIDSYLLVDRHSDLFPDALYEVGVGLREEQAVRQGAARARAARSIAIRTSTKTPTVRILEGNLRIRKAQMLRQAQIDGTVDADETIDPATEYDKADEDLHRDARRVRARRTWRSRSMVDGNVDPRAFIEQIAGRNAARVPDRRAPIPEAAAQWLRDEPEVQRFVEVESDLGEIQANIDERPRPIIERLEGVIAHGRSQHAVSSARRAPHARRQRSRTT